jgi:hypothetical protein
VFLAKFSRFDGVYSQLVKRLGKILSSASSVTLVLLGKGNNKNLMVGFKGVWLVSLQILG